MTRLLTIIGATLVPSVAAAHPDHASGGHFGISHYLADPFHVGVLGAAIVLFLAVRRVVVRRSAMNRRAR
jgi:hypothetical protein